MWCMSASCVLGCSKDVRVEEEQGRKDEAFKLLGQQQLLISQHWDVSTNTLIKLSAELKKENRSLVGQKKAKDLEIETLKAAVSMEIRKFHWWIALKKRLHIFVMNDQKCSQCLKPWKVKIIKAELSRG